MAIGSRQATLPVPGLEPLAETSQLPPRNHEWKIWAVVLPATAALSFCLGLAMDRVLLGATASVLLFIVSAAVIAFGIRDQRRGEIIDNTLEAVAPMLGVRKLSRALLRVSRWKSGWVGTPGRAKLRYANQVNGRDPKWVGGVLEVLDRNLGGRYLVKGHNHRTKLLVLVLDETPAQAEVLPSEQVQRVQAVVKELLGESATVECEEEGDEIKTVTVSHKQGIHMAMVGRRQRVEKVISARMHGRWVAHWDLQNDIVRFTQRPEMPTLVYPVYEDVDRTDAHASYLKLKLPYGVDENGNVIFWQPALNPHMLVVGGTGTGKTVVEHGFLEQIARQGYRIWVIDGKRIEFVGFRGYPNVELVASRVEHQVRMIIAAHELMEERYTLIEAGKATLKDFDALFLIIDEYATLKARIVRWYKSVKQKGDPTQPPMLELIEDLARLARSAKIHMILGLQRPDVSFLGGEMRDNFAARISMGRLSPQGANMMWDSFAIGVALPRNVRGRGVSTDAESNPVEIQTFWNPDPAKGDLPEYLEKAQPEETTYPRMMILDPDYAAELDGSPQDPDSEPGYRDYAEARIVPFDPKLADELAPPPPARAAHTSNGHSETADDGDDIESPGEEDAEDSMESTSGLFEGYRPATQEKASSLEEGDAVLIDEALGLWGIVTDVEPEDDDYLILDYRDIETGEADSASITADTWLHIRRPDEHEGRDRK